jgi:hypothetical protein
MRTQLLFVLRADRSEGRAQHRVRELGHRLSEACREPTLRDARRSRSREDTMTGGHRANYCATKYC